MPAEICIHEGTRLSEAPPSKKRPTWKAATIVDPSANVSGSASVPCWLVEAERRMVLPSHGRKTIPGGKPVGGVGGWIAWWRQANSTPIRTKVMVTRTASLTLS